MQSYQKFVLMIRKRNFKEKGQNIYQDRAAWDAERDRLPIIKQVVSICSGLHRSDYKLQENDSNEGGADFSEKDFY